MDSKAAYVLVFVLFMVFCQAYGQETETNEPSQNAIQGKVESVLEGVDPSNRVGYCYSGK